MLFEAKEHGGMGPSGEDRIPVWSRLQMDLEKRGWEGYINGIFQTADDVAFASNPADPRSSELVQIPNKEFYDKRLTYIMKQISLQALGYHLENPDGPAEPVYIGVTFTFTYDLFGHHTMVIQGQEETYNGPSPDVFALPQDGGDKDIFDAIVQAMMRPADFTPYKDKE